MKHPINQPSSQISNQATTRMFQIDQKLSIVIPRVFPKWINEKKIINVFHSQNIGSIYRVQIFKEAGLDSNVTNAIGPIDKKRSKKSRKYAIYKAVIYFSYWYENDIARNFQKRLIEKNETRVVYDDPWFWKILKNENPKLSKKDKRAIRISQQLYYTILQNSEEINEMNHMHFLQEASIQNCISELKIQNEQMQRLQDFCIQMGLEIPFWDPKHPPSLDVISLESDSAQTAVAASEFVLPDDEEKEYMNWAHMQDTEQTASLAAERALAEMAENVLAEFAEKFGHYEYRNNKYRNNEYHDNEYHDNEYHDNEYHDNEYHDNEYHDNEYHDNEYDDASKCYSYNNSEGCGFIRVPQYQDFQDHEEERLFNEECYFNNENPTYKWLREED